jgi:hypothetical protein
MKKLLTASLFISGILLFASCKKDNSALAPQAAEEVATQKIKLPSTPIRVKTETFNSATKTFTYNADHLSLGNTGASPVTYSYPDSKHIIETAAGTTTTFLLNNKGLIETGTTEYFTQYWSFNNRNQLTEILTKSKTTSDVSSYKYVYNNDNNLDTLYSISNGKISWYETFTYYLDQPTVLSEEFFGEGFKGLGSKNMFKTSVTHYSNSVVTTSAIYEYDPFGRVIKSTFTVNGTVQPYHLYTYY